VRLHHLALAAEDVERVAAFYRDALGLPEVARHLEADGRLRSVWLDLGGAVLMVERGPAGPRAPAGPGIFLLALTVPAEGKAAAELALATRGVPVEARTAHTLYFRDPEGNRVGLSSYPLAEARGDK
jgi:catechol 2,3-dioxygenase-like lactoylglutathione lyase family enzyme